MEKKKIFFIPDYRNVICEPTRDPTYWILKELDRADRFKVYSTTNRVINSSCFRNIDFPTRGYKGKIDDRFVDNDEPPYSSQQKQAQCLLAS